MKDFSEVLECKILEKNIDAGKRTVVAGVLEGDFKSANNRFYPHAVVVEASKGLVGKPSLIGHDSDSPRDIVARISEIGFSGKKLVASFKFGTDILSNEMFTKVKDGLVDSYSIRASGKTKPGMINNEEVDIVQSLDIWSVDLVVQPGVSSAKVLQVYEQSPTIEYKPEINKEDQEMDEKMKLELEETKARALAIEEENKKLVEEKNKLEEANKKAELESYKIQKLSTIEDKDIRADVAEMLDGNTKEEIDAKFAKAKKLAEGVSKKAGSKIVISPIKDSDTLEFHTINDVLESKSVDKKDKVEILSALMNSSK